MDMIFQELGPRVKLTVTFNSMRHSTTPTCIQNSSLDFNVIYCRRYAPYMIVIELKSEVKVKDTGSKK